MMQEWFEDAKLGIFVHWGIYAINRMGSESWPIAQGRIGYDRYLEQMGSFTASDYDPEKWVELFKRAGAKYSVLTTKHHDGVALWPTKQGTPSITNDAGTPDLVQKFVKAVRDGGLNVGLYFSHTDWTRDDHMSVILGKSADELAALRAEDTVYREIWEENANRDHSDNQELQANWDSFMDFHRAQLAEILNNYGTIDLLWFDVMLGHKDFPYPTGEIRDYIHSVSEKTVINSRLGEHGDYETPEQFIPVYPPKGPWELCITTNNTWSYTGAESNYKTPFEIISMFTECLGMGGNMLLNVGPDEAGNIPEQQVALLEELGSWVGKHSEAVYGTRRGLPHGYAYGHSSVSKDKKTLYLYLSHVPAGGETSIKGVRNEIKRVTVLGNGSECAHKRIGGAPWLGVPGILWIDVPEDARDEHVTVIKIELDRELDLYSGEGREIDVN